MKTIKEWQKEIHEYAVEKGWWDEEKTPRSKGDQFANFHAEVSEAWAEWRNGHPMEAVYFKNPHGDVVDPETSGSKPEGVPIELADVVIRIMDTCEAYGIDLEEAIRIKHEFNKTRPHRHGGKRA